jgi:hypothetical protein
MAGQAPTFVRDGLAFVQNERGDVFTVDAAEARTALSDPSRKLRPVSRDYIEGMDAAARQREEAGSFSGMAKTVGETVAGTALDIATAPVRIPLAGAAALGVPGAQTALNESGGARVIENASGVLDELAGVGTAEASAREYGQAARQRAEANPILRGAAQTTALT